MYQNKKLLCWMVFCCDCIGNQLLYFVC